MIILDGTAGIANNATDISYTGTLTGSTGVVNIGSGQVYKDASGNVGIGTSSPGAKLDVNGGINSEMRVTTSGSGYLQVGQFSNGGFIGTSSSDATAGILRFGTGGTERMRIDSAGNLGLGVTPSAWTMKAMQVGGFGAISGDANTIALSQNVYGTLFTGFGATYAQTGQGALTFNLDKSDGAFKWRTAPSGTAGNPITFTQAMTLDASGNLGIGTSSPSSFGKLSVVGGGIYTNNGYALTSDSTYFTPSGLTAIPNYGIGNPAVNQVSLSAFAGLTFYTNQNERMRIDASGNLLVGTTGPGGAGGVSFRPDAAGGKNVVWNRNATTSTGYPLEFQNGGSIVGFVSITNTTTTYASVSDYRLKNTIAPMTGALAKVAALKPVTYKWNADGSDGEGFIAHELAEVCPHAVTGEKDAVDADGKPQYQGIDVSFLVATLTAAIQEQQALITTLTQRISALEAK